MKSLLLVLVLFGCAHFREPQVYGSAAVMAGAAALDASATIHAVRDHGYAERNPLNAPFAGSRWLYAVNTVEALAVAGGMDYLRHRSRFWRRWWWTVPTGQAVLSLYLWRRNVALLRDYDAR